MAKREQQPAPVPLTQDLGFQAYGDHIVVKLEAATSMTEGGLYIPETAKSGDNAVGTVVSVGHGRLNLETGRRLPIDVTVGQRIVIESYHGRSLRLNGQQYLVIRDNHVIALAKSDTRVDVSVD